MVNVVFSYRSAKPIARIELRFVYFIADAQKSIRTRIKKEVQKTFWEEYRKGKIFRDVDKQNLKKELDSELKAIKDFIINAYSPTIEPSREWLINTLDNYYNPKSVNEVEDPKSVNEVEVPTVLLEYFDYYLSKQAKILKHGTIKKIKVVRNKIERFQKATKTIYRIQDVNQFFLDQWIEWNLKENYEPGTINTNFKNIKTICNHAKLYNIEVDKRLDSLHSKVQENKLPVIYLSFDELDKIRATPMEHEYLQNAKDWLLISCYTGQRISDFMRFNSSMIRTAKGRKFIDITQQKTGKKVSIPLLPIVQEILDKRGGNFPRAISHQRYNDFIKEVCRLAGINEPTKGKVIDSKNGVIRKKTGVFEKYKLITSHTGRRSFASNYYTKIPTPFLKNITAHSTETQLLKYIGKDSEDTAPDAYDLMLNLKF